MLSTQAAGGPIDVGSDMSLAQNRHIRRIPAAAAITASARAAGRSILAVTNLNMKGSRMTARRKSTLAAAAAVSLALSLGGAAATASAATTPAATTPATSAGLAETSGSLPVPTGRPKNPDALLSPDSYAAAWVPVPDYSGFDGRVWQTWYRDANDNGYWGHYGATTAGYAFTNVYRIIYYANGTVDNWTGPLPLGKTYYYSGVDAIFFEACDSAGCGTAIEV